MLPQGFTRVEWIQSTGKQYINSKFYPKGNTRVVIDIDITGGAIHPTPFGAHANAIYYSVISLNASTTIRNFYAGKSYDISTSILGRHLIDKDGGTLSIDGVRVHTIANSDFTVPYPLYLFTFGSFETGNEFQAYATLYSGKIYDNGALARDYIAFIDENGDANLWDDISQEPAEKVGTFLHGAPIVPDAISNLVKTNSQNGLSFSWNPSKNANEYAILRNGVQITSVYGDVTSYTDFGVTGEYTYTVTPYNGIQAGPSASIKISTNLDAPERLSATLDDHTVVLAWDDVGGAEGYKVYRDGTVIASVSSASYTDTLIPPASASYAVSAYAGDRVSERSDTIFIANWYGAPLELITDRTAADVAEAKRLRDKLLAGEALTDEEFARYSAGLRGCYNASDMNRVGAAVRYVANRLNAEGYGAHVSPKTDWQMEYAVRQSDWNKYLDEVRHLRRKLTLMRTTPQITDGMYSGLKNHAEANAIEQILVDLDWMLTNIIRDYIYAGEVFAGEV